MSLQFISIKANVLNYVWRLIYLCISIDRMVEVGLRGKKNKMKTSGLAQSPETAF